MIIEDYCSYKTAVLLKEKGFDAEIHMYWCAYPKNPEDGYLERCPEDFEVDNTCSLDYHPDDFKCIAPTLQIAMKWLREKHNRLIEVCADKAHNFKDIVFRPAIYDKELNCLWESDNFPTYEAATEAAIQYCLEYLLPKSE